MVSDLYYNLCICHVVEKTCLTICRAMFRSTSCPNTCGYAQKVQEFYSRSILNLMNECMMQSNGRDMVSMVSKTLTYVMKKTV